MFVRYAMTREIVCLSETMPAARALLVFRRGGFRHAPVTREGRLVGIVSDRDLLRFLPGSVNEMESEAGRWALRTSIGRAMTPDPVTVSPDDSIVLAAELMRERHFDALPVVEDGELVGIVTSADLLASLAGIVASGEGRSVALLLSDRPDDVDPVALSVELGIDVESFLRCSSTGGSEMALLRLHGSAEDLERFTERVQEGGHVLLDGGPEPGRRSA